MFLPYVFHTKTPVLTGSDSPKWFFFCVMSYPQERKLFPRCWKAAVPLYWLVLFGFHVIVPNVPSVLDHIFSELIISSLETCSDWFFWAPDPPADSPGHDGDSAMKDTLEKCRSWKEDVTFTKKWGVKKSKSHNSRFFEIRIDSTCWDLHHLITMEHVWVKKKIYASRSFIPYWASNGYIKVP